jgi:hypothetical protein
MSHQQHCPQSATAPHLPARLELYGRKVNSLLISFALISELIFESSQINEFLTISCHSIRLKVYFVSLPVMTAKRMGKCNEKESIN